jgi:Fe-S oxidoreductase/nitrate reductase gamma subunit
MGRVPYWSITNGILIDLLAIPAMLIFVYGIYRNWKLISQGRETFTFSVLFEKAKHPDHLKQLITSGLLGSKIYRKMFTGIFHGCLFWGMALLFLGTSFVFANVLFGLPVFQGSFNRWVMGFTLDAAALTAFFGVVFLLVRRLIPPERLVIPKSRSSFIGMEVLLLVIIISGIIIEALRIANNGYDPGSFIGNFLASYAMGNINEGTALSFYKSFWWAHGFMALVFIACIPFSPFMHMITVPTNSVLKDTAPGIRLDNMDFSDFEDEDYGEPAALGAATLKDFRPERLLDFSTCLWCGRCHEVCPAAQTGKALSPKGVMVTLAESLVNAKMDDDPIIEQISSDAIFNCTTCGACVEACPASINQPKALMEFRRNLVMESSVIPESMGMAHKSLELRQHPFFGTGAGPNDWCKDLEVPEFISKDTQYLLWIGCAIKYEERAQKIARAMVTILDHCEVSYGILPDSRCTGDPAKMMGNEFLFNEIATQNIEEFADLGVTKIITMCPHCYNSFTSYYPELGGTYDVVPHSVFIQELIASGSLNIQGGADTICYHDPCYLGRHNNIYDDPRKLVSAVGRPAEMLRSRNESFCCGAGGGNYWTEETGDRINQVRAQEALDTAADKIATSCPYCLLMLTDGLKKFTEEEKIFDIAELVSVRLEDK